MATLGKVELGRPATYQDVRAAPEDVVAELIDGELYTQARPRPRHGRVAMQLSTSLNVTFGAGSEELGGWVFLPEPELHLSRAVMVPDLAAWRVERYPPGVDDVVGMETAPDWVCEVLSPSTATKDRALKLPRYGDAGVCWAWLVDPYAETVEVYRREREHWVLDATVYGRDDVPLHPFAAKPLALVKLWPEG